MRPFRRRLPAKPSATSSLPSDTSSATARITSSRFSRPWSLSSPGSCLSCASAVSDRSGKRIPWTIRQKHSDLSVSGPNERRREPSLLGSGRVVDRRSDDRRRRPSVDCSDRSAPRPPRRAAGGAAAASDVQPLSTAAPRQSLSSRHFRSTRRSSFSATSALACTRPARSRPRSGANYKADGSR